MLALGMMMLVGASMMMQHSGINIRFDQNGDEEMLCKCFDKCCKAFIQ